MAKSKKDTKGHPPAERVVVEDPEHMNLLGLLMKGLLTNNLARDDIYARACSIKGDVLVQAGDMPVTLRFGGGKLTIVRGATKKTRASVAGSIAPADRDRGAG